MFFLEEVKLNRLRIAVLSDQGSGNFVLNSLKSLI